MRHWPSPANYRRGWSNPVSQTSLIGSQ
jgi:hypothetical protein